MGKITFVLGLIAAVSLELSKTVDFGGASFAVLFIYFLYLWATRTEPQPAGEDEKNEEEEDDESESFGESDEDYLARRRAEDWSRDNH